jgi:spermidine synthase
LNAALLASVFVIATAGLVYELLAGTIASYLLGDSVTQFSTVIGAYLFSMGVGSYLAKFLKRGLVAYFIQVEILVAIVGGCSATVLFLSFEQVNSFRIVLYGTVGLVGMLVGMEIPLLLRILEGKLQFSELISRVLSIDYLGALAASILFPCGSCQSWGSVGLPLRSPQRGRRARLRWQEGRRPANWWSGLGRRRRRPPGWPSRAS